MAKLDRRLITSTALTIIDEDVDAELTLSELARRLDVTQPALYYHVDGIDDIHRWIGIEVRAQLADLLTQAAIGVAGEEAVRKVAAAWRRFAHASPARYRSTEWHPVEGDAELEGAVGEVLRVLGASLRGYELPDDDRLRSSLALRAMLHGFALFELSSGNPAPSQTDATFDGVLELFLRGVASLEAAATRS